MARGINKVILVGNLGRDPEIRYTASGAAVATVSLATSESWKDKQSGEQQERTEWHRVVFFNRLAEIVAEYLHKGSQIYTEGKLQTNKWQDDQGQDRYTTEIIASEMQMLGGRQADRKPVDSYENHTGSDNNQSPANNSHKQDAPNHPPQTSEPQEQVTSSKADDFDDDIPF